MSVRFGVVDLMTVDDLRVASNASYGEDLPADYETTTLTPIIKEISSQFAAYIQQHILRAERMETYNIRGNARVITLKGTNIDPDSVMIEVDCDFLDESDYTLTEDTGWIQLCKPISGRRSDTFKVIVTCVSGLAVDTAGIKADHPDLHAAAMMQAKYRMERKDNVGGPLTVPQGVSATSSGQYQLLRHVRSILDGYRRFSG